MGISNSIFLLGKTKNSNPSPYRKLIDEFIEQGTFISPENDPEFLTCYDRDSQNLFSMQPLLVFKPHSLSSISTFILSCKKLNIPVTSRCGGTGLVGGAAPSQGGVVILTGHFRRILHYDVTKGEAIIEPGVTVHQLRNEFESDNWHFPLEMASGGSAGLAGCLSSHAQGYHQSEDPIAKNILNVTFFDGHGDELKSPGYLLCGSEGIFGVITKLHIKLEAIPEKRVVIQVSSELQSIIDKIDQIKCCSSIKSLVWNGADNFILVIEGEHWRVEGSLDYLQKILGPYVYKEKDWILNFDFPAKNPFFTICNALNLENISKLTGKATFFCSELNLTCKMYSNLLNGSLYILLSSENNTYEFSQKIDKFLIHWVEILEKYNAYLVSQHGVGPYLRHYIPPFSGEEDLRFLKKVCSSYDSENLFAKNRFFPSVGKSIEKVLIDEK
ncbi:MAG: FAD-binding oxidoreductase [Parachlamydiaceae bacterium]|nr:FAD-binding oxidoreductase [Parachlamydiaceae bacterium]